MMRLKDKVALITGSSRGIGKAIALLFAKEGAKIVVIHNKSEEQADQVVKDIDKLGSKALSIKCDVSNEDDVKRMTKKTIDTFGKIDILVNCAGIVFDVPLFEKTVEQWDKTFGVNLKGIFLCSKYASEHLKKQESGIIINIASNNGIQLSFPESADYDASKAGVVSFTKALSEELAPKIRVNVIAPGWIDTDMNKDLPDDLIREEKQKTFMKRFGKPEEVASVALFLSTNDSSFMTGSIITVDGGYK